MRLVSLRLAGFKSFADKTILPFAPGINAVIGPNGSGKSNLIDALRWSTGGGRANAFRAEDKTELIFHGTRQHKTLGYAEVEVRLEQDSTPIIINRNLSRDGSSQLKLAGKNARFLDVDELLAGSGLGRSGLAVIGQGEVSDILTASPAALLDTIAEAAGVTRLRQRRDKTMMRLEQAQTHLAEVITWLATLSEQYHKLRQEARQAALASALERAILRLRYTLAWSRCQQLQADLVLLTKQHHHAQSQQHTSEQALAQAQQRWQHAQAHFRDAEAAWHVYQRRSETVRGDIRVVETRLAALEQRITQHQHDLTRIARERTELLLVEPSPPAPARHLTAKQYALTAALAALEPQTRHLQTAYHTAKDDLARAEQAWQQYVNAKQVYDRGRAQYQQQLSALEEVLASAPETPHVDLDQLEQDVQQARQVVSEQQRVYDDKHAARQQAQQAHANAAAEVLALERQHQRLEQAFSQRTGYAQGAKVVLRSDHPDVMAAVADVLEIPDAYRTAITSALGRRAEHVIIRRAAAAPAILSEVRRAGAYVTLLPLDLLSPSVPVPPTFAAEPGVIGLASEIVHVDDTYHAVIWQLLGRTVLVETLEHATDLAKRFARRPRLVSLTGDIIENYGAISGGKSHRGDDGRVLKRDVTASAEALQAARILAAERSAQCDTLHAELAKLRETLQQSQHTLEHAQTALQTAREQHASQQATLAAQTAQYQATLTALNNLPLPTPPNYQDANRKDTMLKDVKDLEHLRTHASRLYEHVTANQRQQQYLQQQQHTLAADWRVYHEQQRNYQQALQSYQANCQRLERLNSDYQHTQSALAQCQTERDQLKQTLATTRAQLPDDNEVRTTLDQAQTVLQQCQQQLEIHNQQHAKNAAACSDISVTLARKQATLDAAEGELADFPEGLEPLRGATTINPELDTVSLEADVMAWLTQVGVWTEPPLAPLVPLVIADTSSKTLKHNLEHAERERAQLGAVNYRAQQDQRSAAEHLGNISRDAQDAQDAVTALQHTLSELDDSIHNQLEQAVVTVRQRFQEKVTVLFGENAQADLQLTYQDGRPSGITLALQPANKTTRSLNLLSVGERTMGAMAFLFALMEGEHALPIAILDEVDAPLDEANIRRFRDFVRKLASQGTQFLLITHQKATMECADVLWGVTTQDGVSRIFSIQRDESVDNSMDDAAD